VHQDDEADADAGAFAGVNQQFGARMRESRESRGWSQRQLAEMLRTVDLKLDPSAITRIERGTRDVRLAEAVAIASVLEFGFDSFSFSPESDWMMREVSQLQMTIRARRAVLDAVRQIDRWVNNSSVETEDRLLQRRGLSSYVDLYTQAVNDSRAFRPGGSLGHEGDNFAVYFNDDDRLIKQAIVDAVIAHLLVSEEEFETFAAENRKALGRGLARLIPPFATEEGGDDAET